MRRLYLIVATPSRLILPIVGCGTLVKDGSGILTLGATTQAYTGALTVNQGELRISGNIALNPITINGGKLSCIGTVTGDISLSGGGLAPGQTGGGLLTANHVSMGSGHVAHD